MVDQTAPSPASIGAAPAAGAGSEKASGYAFYALALLIAANFFNYVDRHVLSVVGQSIKQDIGLTDAQLGFLMGTAFAVLYGVAGIAMGRISDVLSRTKLMAAALAFWSGLTAFSGLAVNFAGLATARIGVGLGEAAANPCSHSLLSDYFPARNRAAALGSYLLGIHLGSAGSLVLGALLLQHWDTLCTYLPGDACRIASWRAAFFVVGAPGLLLALLVLRLREPSRAGPGAPSSPLRVVLRELSAAVPPFTVFNLYGVGGQAAVVRNLALAGVLAALAWALATATGDWLQWAALAVGGYSVLTWRQVISLRDRPLHDLTFGCPTFAMVMLGGGLSACFSGSVMTWSAPYAMRTLGAQPGDVGLALGGVSIVAAGASVVLGGWIADRWRRRDRRAPMWIGLIALVGPIPFLALMLAARDLPSFSAALFGFALISMCWSGAFGAVAQDLVLPRMRGAAAAVFSLVMVLISAGLGPYWAGKISALTGSLATGLVSLVAVVPIAAAFMIAAALRLPGETADRRRARAAAAGERL